MATDAEIRSAFKTHGTIAAASRATGAARNTVRRVVGKQQEHGAKKPIAEVSRDERVGLEVEYPDLPSSELPATEIIDQASKRFARRLAAVDARRWFEIKIKNNKPLGVVFMGDPHIDNSGCNWPLLSEHIRILETTPGLHAIGCNDIADNWIGRLMRLYADQEMSRKQTNKIIKWLLKESKVSWLCHILGNHDQWGDGPYLIKAAAQPMVPVEDWQARFQLVFKNGVRSRIHMAHDFPGHSQWNNLHGAQKQAMWGEEADIYACAHKHNWMMAESEHPHKGFVYSMIRARGYKFIDQYADNGGYGNQRHGASITAIIDPVADGTKRVRCFPDVAEAAEFLTWKRARA